MSHFLSGWVFGGTCRRGNRIFFSIYLGGWSNINIPWSRGHIFFRDMGGSEFSFNKNGSASVGEGGAQEDSLYKYIFGFCYIGVGT